MKIADLRATTVTVPLQAPLRHANPTTSLYNNRTPVLAALEFACLDLLGQAWDAPVCEILGGRVRDRVRFASYDFFRYADPETGRGEVRTIEQLVDHVRELKQRFGFTTHKLKGGVFPPRTTNSRPIARWRPRSREIVSASIRTPSGRRPRPSASDRRSTLSPTTTSKTRCSV